MWLRIHQSRSGPILFYNFMDSPKKERDLVKLFSQNNQAAIEDLLSQDPNLKLHLLSNSKMFNILHFTCFNNNFPLTKFVLDYCQKSSEISKTDITAMVNAQNKDGFTPLHMASYKGNLDIIKLLLQCGSDYTIRNSNGLSVLHMSVQGEHVRTSYFWIKIGIPIDQSDNNNHTPLTWAAFLGSIQMVNFLIPWGANINHVTSDKGQTALHIATQQGVTRIVRKLLIKGINRNLRDKHGKTALDVARESRFKTIQMMIENQLGILERCGIRQPYSKVEKQYVSAGFFILATLSCVIMTLIFTMPFIQKTGLLISFLILSSLMFIAYCLASVSDPGQAEKQQNLDIMEMLEKYNVDQICPDCQLVRPDRARHCEICQRCILTYDHHCPWLSNCIGEKNLLLFLVFLSALIATMIMEIVIQSQTIKINEIHNTAFFEEASDFLLFWKQVTLYYTLAINCLFILPVTGLLVVQITNIIKGQTTYERYSKKSVPKAQLRKASGEPGTKKSKSSSGDTLSIETSSTTDDDYKAYGCCGNVNKKKPKGEQNLKKPLIKETEFA